LFIVTSVVVIKQSPVGRWIFAESQAKYSRFKSDPEKLIAFCSIALVS